MATGLHRYDVKTADGLSNDRRIFRVFSYWR
jgi:hypothetical protein